MARNKRSLLAQAAAVRENGRSPKRIKLSGATEDASDPLSPSSLGSDESMEVDEAQVTGPEDNEEDDNESTVSRIHENESETSQTISQSNRPNYSDEQALARLAQEKARRANQPRNQVAENAIIEEVTCINFMCHSSLVVKLGPLINFIIGHNGSGKSAVLTALIICLGGKASATSRGNSLKAFIKEGTEKCTLKVRIKNQGRSAYKPDTFGDSIIVERHFTRSGTSGFNIRNANSKSVSTSRADVDDILDYFALQLDNPMNVLTQDQARAFLNSASNKDKYRFFSKGTQLEQLDNDYQNMEDLCDKLELNMAIIQEQVQDLKQRYEIAHKNTQTTAGMRKLNEELNRLRTQMCWVQVEAQEKTLHDSQAKIEDCTNFVESAKQEFEEASRAHADVLVKKDSAEARHRQLKEEEYEPLLAEKKKFREEMDTAKDELQKLIQDGRTIMGEMTTNETTINDFQEQIKAERQKLENQSGAIAKINARLNQTQIEHDDAEREFEDCSARETGLEKEKNALFHALTRPSKEVEEQTARVNECKNRIKKINEDRGQLSRSPQLRAVLAEISRTEWRQTPVGPISDYVFLKEPKWSPILERQFGTSLNSFVVTNKEDSTKLLAIIHHHKLQNTNTYIGNARRIDTSKHEPPSHLLTWLRALNITNDLVRNQLIINQGIDKTVLIESREETVFEMEKMHKNVRQYFCFTDSQTGAHRGSGLRLHSGGGNGSSTSPIRPWGVARHEISRMRMDVNAQLDLEKDNLQQDEHLLAERQAALKKANNDHDAKANAYNVMKRKVSNLKVKRDSLENQIHQIRDEFDEATPQNGKIETLETELEKKQQAQEVTLSQYEGYESEKEKKNQTNRQLLEELKKVNADLNIVKNKVEDLLGQVTTLQQQTQQKLYAKNEHDASVRHAEQNKESQEQNYQQEKAKLDGIIEQATEVCARVRVPPNETYETLNTKFLKMQRDLDHAQTQAGGSEEQLKEREGKAKDEYQERVETHKQHHDLTILIKSTLMERRNRWKKFRDFIALKACTSFSFLLSERQFRGSLTFRHDSKELDIQVEPDITRKSDKGRQTKTLSGGEKSFSTICLLLALWDAMGSPIRCLDEFDVFMDNVNRDVSVKMLIQAARSHASRQFVMITPQSMVNIPLDSDVKIHKMLDPERGQIERAMARAS